MNIYKALYFLLPQHFLGLWNNILSISKLYLPSLLRKGTACADARSPEATGYTWSTVITVAQGSKLEKELDKS